MALITLTNDFHNSSINIRCEVLSHIHNVATAYPNASQIKRAKKALCGVSGCCCSRDDGTRGKQDIDGKTLEVDLTEIYSEKAGYKSKGTR